MSSSTKQPVTDYEARVRASFARQVFMTTLGARIESVEPGKVVIALPFHDELMQQHGFLHAGVVGAIADSACGYAALTLMPPDTAVLSVEYKINLLRPAAGSSFRAVGQVIRAGRTLSVCSAEVQAEFDGKLTAIAVMQATIMTVRDRPELID